MGKSSDSVTTYNRLAGGSVERLAALSDGVFAVAMTLMLLDLHAPELAAARDGPALLHVLIELAPGVLVYTLSFMTLGIFWVGQQTQLNQLARSDRDLTWLHLAFLFAVTLMPFSTQVIARFTSFRPALVVYWANILLLGLLLYASWCWSAGRGLLREDVPEGTVAAVKRRILVAQACYAAATAFCLITNWLSVGLIVLIQLYYVVAPLHRRTVSAGPENDPG